ncbi:MAG: dTMP kinase [Deltaproteobacteria bacterium]|nr:dTMP kinase [Deltaproteobacteria bacterium]
MIVNSADQILNDPKFIVLEGVNGAGKSTLQRKIKEHFESSGHNVVCTREPGPETKLGKTLRKVILESEPGTLSEIAELFLFSSDRNQHVREIIKPALERGEVVLCDRYFYSSIAFQGYGRGIDLDKIERISAIAIEDTLPDLVILLDLDPEVGLKRNNNADLVETDAFEKEDLAFQHRIRDGFLEIAKKYDQPFVVIDASQSPEKVWEDTKAYL